MKVYSDKDTVTYVQTIASANTFVSSVVGIIKNKIISAFPKEYFKSIYTDTSETYQEHNKNQLYSKTLYKIAYPSLTITPQLSLDNPVGGMKNILMSSPNFWIPRESHRYYPLLVDDPDKSGRYKIFFSSDYTTLNIRFKIITDSFIQATNIGYWLKSRFDDATFKYMSNQALQVEVPKPFIYSIAKIDQKFGVGGDTETNKEDLKWMDEFLASVGKRATPILRKTSLNTGKECYFFEEKTNLLTLFTDLDIPEGIIRDNSVNSEYEINFRVQVSAWWPNAFIMTINRDAYKFLSDLSEANPLLMKSLDLGDSFYSTSIGSPILLDRKNTIYFNDSTGTKNIGQNIVHEVLTYDKATAMTHLNIPYFLPDDVLKAHSYMVEHNMDTSKLINIIVRSYSYGQAALGTPDYDNLSVDFAQPVDSDIVLDTFVNRAMYESVAESMRTDTFYSNSRAISTITVQSIDEDEIITEEDGSTHPKLIYEKIRVYLFNDENEMKSTEMEKSIRVMTMYGIGYVGLVRENEVGATNFKICLGQDKYGNNIIRCLERV